MNLQDALGLMRTDKSTGSGLPQVPARHVEVTQVEPGVFDIKPCWRVKMAEIGVNTKPSIADDPNSKPVMTSLGFRLTGDCDLPIPDATTGREISAKFALNAPLYVGAKAVNRAINGEPRSAPEEHPEAPVNTRKQNRGTVIKAGSK